MDKDRKLAPSSFMNNPLNFQIKDSKYFDFIPLAFSKTSSKNKEAFFINNNFTIEQLIKTNKNDLLNEEHSARSQLFFKMQNSSSFYRL